MLGLCRVVLLIASVDASETQPWKRLPPSGGSCNLVECDGDSAAAKRTRGTLTALTTEVQFVCRGFRDGGVSAVDNANYDNEQGVTLQYFYVAKVTQSTYTR